MIRFALLLLFVADVASSLNCTVANEVISVAHSDCHPPCERRTRYPVCQKTAHPPSCQCKYGYFRAKNGQCVTYEQCAKQSYSQEIHVWNSNTPLPNCTRPNEEVSHSMKSCARTCSRKNLPMACGRALVAGNCQCTRGFFRAENGECVTLEQCPKQSLPTRRRSLELAPVCTRANEVLAHSDKSCDRTCENRRPACNKMRDVIGNCQCAIGFYRADNGECVTVDQCPE